MQEQGIIESTGGPEFTIAKQKTFSITGTTEMFGYNLKSVFGVPILIWIALIVVGVIIYYNKK